MNATAYSPSLIEIRTKLDLERYPTTFQMEEIAPLEDAPYTREGALTNNCPWLLKRDLISSFSLGECLYEGSHTRVTVLANASATLPTYLSKRRVRAKVLPAPLGSLFPGEKCLYYIREQSFEAIRGTVACEILSTCAGMVFEGDMDRYLLEPICRRLQPHLDETAGEKQWFYRHWDVIRFAAETAFQFTDLTQTDHSDLRPMARQVWKTLINLEKD